jgi:hypothetical protein
LRIFAAGPRWILLAEQGFDITPCIQQMHDAHARFGDAIKDEILSDQKAPITAPQVVPAAACPGLSPSNAK